jgi:DNA modification methylase
VPEEVASGAQCAQARAPKGGKREAAEILVTSENRTLQLIVGDALEELRKLPDHSVDCCVTSPPYWGLRQYDIRPSVWNEDPYCKHEWEDAWGAGGKRGHLCRFCEAWLGALGMEPWPQMFVHNLCEVCDEIARVLKPRGTFWLNIGDSYYDGPAQNGFKPKDLCGIPWETALSLRSRGWWLRQDIIWAKANPLPEPVLDRCVRSHEYLFLLTRSRKYYFDYQAIEEPCTDARYRLQGKIRPETSAYNPNVPGEEGFRLGMNLHRQAGPRPTRRKRSVWRIPTQPVGQGHNAAFPVALARPCVLAGCPPDGVVLDPFCGTGTVGVVAVKHGRRFIGIDISQQFIEIARRRIESAAPLFVNGGGA